jgi:hypothetical protein
MPSQICGMHNSFGVSGVTAWPGADPLQNDIYIYTYTYMICIKKTFYKTIDESINEYIDK